MAKKPKKQASPVVVLCTGAQAKKYARILAKHYGLKNIIFQWGGTLNLGTYSSLYLTASEDVFNSVDLIGVIKCCTIQEAIEEVNQAIPLTPWLEGKPALVGEYNASITYSPYTHRWWDGEYWSTGFKRSETMAYKNMCTKITETNLGNAQIRYRGLSRPPIILEE